jgi:hypothetical protein
MRNLNKIASVFCTAALGLLTLTGCEGGDLYDMDTPDWITEKIDSINNANKTDEEVLEGMMEDVYTIGNTDYSSGFWTAFSKYYVVPENTKWNAVFNLNLNPDDNTYYKNFALIITNDADRGSTDYKEYGAIRFDATGDSTSYNSQWGSTYYKLPFKYSTSNLLLAPDASNADANVQKLGGKITLTVDRSKTDSFVVKMTNGTVTKTYTQPYALANLNTDQADTDIRCFLVPEGSYINFLQTNIVPIGGTTSADDKNPVSMVLENVPEEVTLGTTLDSAMSNVSAVVTFEEGVTKTVTASELMFSAINDMNVPGQKTLIAIYNKTFKGENCDTPIVANATFSVVQKIASIKVTTQPTHTTYYYYSSEATGSLSNRRLAFDPTGMQVTATYEDGSSAVIGNDHLTYSSVPATVGSHKVTLTTENGVTTTVTVNVEESTSAAVANSSALVGLEDNSTGWWTAFTDDFKVPNGATRSLSFTNYTDKLNNWDNFVVILRNASLTEYAVVRSDDYGWGNGYASCTHAGTGSADWATWLSAMNGATVTVYVTNCGNGTADIQAVMKGTNGTTYTQYYLGISTVDTSDLNFALTCDHSHLVFSSASAKRHTLAAGSHKAYRR